jgi:hypothetical protein
MKKTLKDVLGGEKKIVIIESDTPILARNLNTSLGSELATNSAIPH